MKQPIQLMTQFNLKILIKMLIFSKVVLALEISQEFSIKSLSYSGTGCRQDSVASLISPDNKAFTLLFDSFIVDTSSEAIPRKSCKIQLELNHPEDWSFGIYAQDTHGFANLPKGTSASQRTNYTLGNNRNVEVGEIRLIGPYENDYQKSVVTKLDVFGWSQCGKGHDKLIIDTIVRVNGTGLMTVDSTDGQLTQHYSLVWKKCEDTRLPRFQKFVESLYVNTLKRRAEPRGKHFWINQLKSGKTYEEVAYSFLVSDEYRELILDEIYEEYLGRRIDASGKSFWLSKFKLGYFVRDIRSFILASEEYFIRAQGRLTGSAEARFIGGLYMDVLFRKGGESEIFYWESRLKQVKAKDIITKSILNSEEAFLLSLDTWYENYFHRNPDESGKRFWVTNLQNGMTDEKAQSKFLGSPEYVFE